MKKITKLARLSGLALANGISLHKNSVILFNNKSFPASLALSILAQEEIGKAFLLQEYCYHYDLGEIGSMGEFEKEMPSLMTNHRYKQGWLSYEIGDYLDHSDKKRFPVFIRDIINGNLDTVKQNAIYVGLEMINKKKSLDGKIINPKSVIKREYVIKHITRLNDWLIELSEGCRRGASSVDTFEMDRLLSIDLVNELEKVWQHKSKESIVKLDRLREIEIDEECAI